MRYLSEYRFPTQQIAIRTAGFFDHLLYVTEPLSPSVPRYRRCLDRFFFFVAGDVKLFVNKNMYNTSNFTTAQSINDTEIKWSAGNKTQLSVIYDSGVGAVIDVFSSQLSIRVMSSSQHTNKTLGLLGVNNNDINDDFTRPDGTILPLNSTQEEIYYQFGKLCMYSPKYYRLCLNVCMCTYLYSFLYTITGLLSR